MYFTSPASNITPAMTSVAMSRSDSRDSTSSTSNAYCSATYSSAYASLTLSNSPSSWPSTRPQLTRTTSNTSSATSSSTTSSASSLSTTSHLQHTSTAMRRGSSSTWIPSPYRSAMHGSYLEEPSSYLSDDDLLFLNCQSDKPLPIESIPNLEPPKKEMTTEEQIAVLRELQEREDATSSSNFYRPGHGRGGFDERKRVVRFAGLDTERRAVRRSSPVKRRMTTVRRGTTTLNGPQ